MAKIKDDELFTGYQANFIAGHHVPLPKLNEEQRKDVSVDENGNSVLNYINYSLQISSFHKFPFYTASNINGEEIQKVARKDSWRKDPRIPKDAQWGNELYTAANSFFDRGHMTKREDVQWGETIEKAVKAADSTFYFTNSVPQHRALNRAIWRRLEDYILHTETKKKDLKICVFTGPVLTEDNPYFVTLINDKTIQIPVIFWKVVLFQKNDGLLYRVGFMMSQYKLLSVDKILMELETDSNLFMLSKDSETYQVRVPLIEELSGITFPSAVDIYNDERSIRLILKEIEIDSDLESDEFLDDDFLGFSIENLII